LLVPSGAKGPLATLRGDVATCRLYPIRIGAASGEQRPYIK